MAPMDLHELAMVVDILEDLLDPPGLGSCGVLTISVSLTKLASIAACIPVEVNKVKLWGLD